MNSLIHRLLLTAFLLGPLLTAQAGTDNYSTGPGEGGPDSMCDVWQAIYLAWGFAPGDDEDSDGCSNLVESIAGTDPRNPADCLKVGTVALAPGSVIFTFDAEAGKKYRILSSNDPGGPYLTVVVQDFPVGGETEYIPMADNPGEVISGVRPSALDRRFYKLEASDVDTDEDGVSDWAEISTGLNPMLKDSDGDGIEDGEVIEAEVSAPDIVSIESTTTLASEDGPQNGMFTVRRTRSLVGATVSYAISGTAAAPGDFSASPAASLVFAPGEKAKQIHINPVADAEVEGSESVTAALTTVSAGQYAAPEIDADKNEATVIIHNSTVATGTGLTARYYDHASGNAEHGANFGDLANYAYVRTSTGTPNTGTITIPYTKTPVVEVGNVVRVSFNGGNLNNALYNHRDYTVSAVTATNFTLAITGASLPTNSNSGCYFSIRSFPHPAVIERVDATVDNDWQFGTPNGNTITGSDIPDNYSSVWDGYLHPTTAGSYQFRMDADDKGRILLDLNRNGTFDLPGEQVVEHGWDASATAGVFNQGAAVALGVPANPGERYRMRIQMVETTGEARCRVQWRRGTAAFGNIGTSNVYAHAAAMNSNYNYTRTSSTAGSMTGTILVTLNGHGLAVNDTVDLTFSSGNLFNPANGNFHGSYTVSAVNTANTFTVPIAAATLPSSGTGAGFVLNRPTSGTTGFINQLFGNLEFNAPPGRVGNDSTNVTNITNGLLGLGTPDLNLINHNTFSVRWTGQVQPQFTEDYTFAVQADNGCRIWINGVEQDFRVSVSSNNGGSTYTYNGSTGDAIVTYTNSALALNEFAVGDVVRLDPTSGSLASLGTLDYTVTAATSNTFTVNFGTTFSSGSGNMNIDFLGRKLKPWGSTGAERYCRIPMIGGVRYDIRLDYYESTGRSYCRLYWYSPSQPKQIIPAHRLYPESEPVAPPAHLSETEATALVGGLFAHHVQGSNGADVSVSGNPAWLTYSNGVLSGTPPPGNAGDYQILLTITNGSGTSTSVLNLHVEDTGATIARESWDNAPGTSVTDIPLGSQPDETNNLASLEAETDAGDNYGARIRGYITAPVTGNYHFWLAASNAAELWISNDDETVNAFKRAWVTTGSTTPQTWTVETSQKSPWLALEQGKRYYIEILHKAGVGAGDNLAVGWSKPGEPTNAPSEIVPGYVLSPYVEPAPGSTPGTLYVATMLAQGSAVTSGVGSSTLRLSEDETYAIMTRTYSNLSGALTSEHIHVDPYLDKPSAIVFDIDDPGAAQINAGGGIQPDGSYKWIILPVGPLSKDDIVEILKQGKAYINLHTALYPNGEIRGNYTLANGSRTFTPPPPPPTYADDHDTDAGAVRFLTQSTYGASIQDIAVVKAMPSYEAWIDDQFTKPASLQLPEVLRTEFANAQGGAFDETLTFNAWWRNSISGEDQLRQRVAFALSEIHVISAQGPLDNRANAISYFYDKLAENAFGNFRDILEDTTLTWAMGRYLDMWRNDKPDPALGRIPNENYAREIKQLFAIGLFRMWPDGSLILSSKDTPIDTYSQREIVGYSHVFTGWDYGYDGPYRTSFNAAADFTRPMREVPVRHFTGQKRLLNNEVLPGLPSVGGQPLDPFTVHNSMHYNDPAYQALPVQELELAHDQLFNHPNVGPFICRQLIQRLVTSHPSRDYLYRVVQKFNDNGSGVRGDMKAVIKAILLDYEARSPDLVTKPAFGKQREPVMRVAAAGRAFRPATFTGTYTQSDASQTTNHQIFITTASPHNLANGNLVFLEFEGATGEPPFIGSYSVANATSTTFRVTDKSWAFSSGTGYTIPANSTTCTAVMSNHWLQPGHQVFVDFRTGGAAGDANLDRKVYAVTATSGQTGTNATFTFQIPATEVSTSARTGAFMIQRFTPGSYTARASGLPYPNDRRVTMDTNFDHNLKVGDQVQLNYTAGNPLPADAVVTVDTVEDLNTWTYLTNSDPATGFAANENNNGVYQFPLAPQPQNRNGTVGSRPSTFNMRNTDADLDQSPLNAPTVFNFFLPDFKNPGALASQGITTPEFQTTAETTVIRQANYFYNGLFNPSTTNGYSSFANGNNSLVLDLSPWMPQDATNVGLGAPTSTTLPWTHNQNLDELIDQFSVLLTADQLSGAAKAIIRNFVGLKLASIAATSPCTVTTVEDHGYTTGDQVVISGATGGTYSTGTFNNNTTLRTITVTGPKTFTVNGVNCSAAPSSVTNAHVSQVVYSNGTTNPSSTNKRDRLRAIIHLILTSADFTIQR